MNIEEFRNYCLAFPETSESLPFDENTLVFKVFDKMFAATDLNEFESINLKCDPEKALELREMYEAIQPGYHMSKRHWNTILMNGELTDDEIRHWIRHSYELVVDKLPRRQRELLNWSKT
ncbi:MmcQ/YjbR family DNA-binding protein [Eisenibacter elegans]|jgi:predicted DNA-binding protein (MmcQ/YjbR family)|uniref:MmcQ/YjbR family DNA-binding protein n=1 Tax=Eisenibacter elegans TaxID=997 RepID=UPI00047B8BD0|nr:MmcQ/YjbR family DNA-binding protein [Eisenibacter elegans]